MAHSAYSEPSKAMLVLLAPNQGIISADEMSKILRSSTTYVDEVVTRGS